MDFVLANSADSDEMSCTDPESFVRGGPTLKIFFLEGGGGGGGFGVFF